MLVAAAVFVSLWFCVSPGAGAQGVLRIGFREADGKPIPKARIKELICRDLKDEPFITRVSLQDGRADVVLPDAPVQISVLTPIQGIGEVVVYADGKGKGYTRPGTLDFFAEAAATRLIRTRAAIEQAESEGMKSLDSLRKRLEAAGKLPSHKSLAATLALGEEITIARARHRISRFGSPRKGFLFGCNAFGLSRRGPDYDRLFKALFNYGTTNLYLSHYAPTETTRDFTRTDAETEWLLSQGMAVKPCPPFYLASGILPQWLKEKSWPDIQNACRQLVAECCRRYAGRASFCEITNEATMSNGLGLSTQQIIELTRIASEAAREGDPKVKRIINSAHLWGDFAARPDKQGRPRLSPYAYLRECISAGIEFEIVGLQLYYPEYDLLEIDRMLDRYASLGKPIHVTEMACSSAPGLDPNAQRRKAAAGWHGPWTEQMQADWVEAIYTLLYSKPYIQAISWWDLADGGSFWPYGGLIRADLSPKPSYIRLSKLLSGWRN